MDGKTIFSIESIIIETFNNNQFIVFAIEVVGFTISKSIIIEHVENMLPISLVHLSFFKKEVLCSAILLVVWASLYIPDLGRMQFVHEEGRRALSAQEIQVNNDYILPTVLGVDYLNKPPGFSWLILLSGFLFNEINEFSLRFVSALSTGITTILIFFFARNELSLRTRMISAFLFFITILTVEKGRLGEIEASFALFVWLALWLSWCGFQNSKNTAWWIAAGGALGFAFMLKGPAALLFFYGAVISYCYYSNKLNWLISKHHLMFLGTTLAILACWLLPLVDKLDWEPIWETLTREVAQRGSSRWRLFFEEQGNFIWSSFFGLMPCSLLALAYFWRRQWRGHRDPVELQRYLWGMVVTGLLFFLIYPDARARYLYPLTPALACLAGMVWSKAMDHSGKTALDVITTINTFLIGLVGFIFGFGGLYLAFSQEYREVIFFISGLAVIPFTILLIIQWKERFHHTSVIFQATILILAAEIGISGEIMKYKNRKQLESSAEQIVSFLPPDQTLYTLTWSEFNLFFYVNNPVQYIKSIDQLPKKENQYVVYKWIDIKKEFAGWELMKFRIIELPYGNFIWLAKIRSKTNS